MKAMLRSKERAFHKREFKDLWELLACNLMTTDHRGLSKDRDKAAPVEEVLTAGLRSIAREVAASKGRVA
jgi:hypothetical protein